MNLSDGDLERLADLVIRGLTPVVTRQISEILPSAVDDRLVSMSEAAQMLGISRHTFWKMRSSGRFNLRPHRIEGKQLYLKSEIEAFLRSHREGSSPNE